MPRTFKPFQKGCKFEFHSLFRPAIKATSQMPALNSKGNRPLQMTFEEHLRALVYFHLEEHHSAQHLLQVLEEDDFAKSEIAPENGIKKSSFSEATNSRGLEQFMHVFQNLQAQAAEILPKQHPELGNLMGIDGSLINASLSMHWADYRKKSKKAKVHVGFDLNQAIPRRIYLTDGKGAERPFVNLILSEGQTGVMDRGYQSHKHFDQWQRDRKSFMCRIKASTKKTIIRESPTAPGSIVFFDAIVILGTTEINRTKEPLRLVGYEVDRVKYWIATNRVDLTAEQIAAAYKLRWDIENFFAWWKRHLKVYHLIARSEHGLMVQILAGLITYLLLAIYCHREFNERVSIKRVRQLRIKIQNELRASMYDKPPDSNSKEQQLREVNAKT
ncbi:IS4 family transposase [Desulfosarcina alkanivorans]